MANADAMFPCRFLWEITNPFLHWRRFHARFYTGTPTPRQWKVNLTPTPVSPPEWHILFSLQYVQLDEAASNSFFANSLKVNVFLDGRNRFGEEKQDYLFGTDNHHRYSFEHRMFVNPSAQGHRLSIEVEIDFRAQNFGPRPRHGLSYTPADLEGLSADMEKLFRENIDPDMIIRSRNRTAEFGVHYCILAVRWEGFLVEENRGQPPVVDVQTDISDSVLSNVLVYMYSGQVGETWLDWNHLASRAELFQVIDRYRIYHLYKVFVTRDSGQVRRVLKNMTGYVKLFPLGMDVDQRVLYLPYYWAVVRNGTHLLTFQIQFIFPEGEGEPWFSYYLISESRYHVLVSMTLVRDQSNPDRRTSWHVHQGVHRTVPVKQEPAGTCHFEGHDIPLNDIKRGRFREGGSEVCFFVVCTLNISDGTESVVVESEGNAERQYRGERLNVLSDHLYRLQRRYVEADLRVVCPDAVVYSLHRAILSARVPLWKTAFLDDVDADPGAAVITGVTGVSSEAFRYVVDYMYTGKTFEIPPRFFGEIHSFAEDGEFAHLKRLIFDLAR